LNRSVADAKPEPPFSDMSRPETQLLPMSGSLWGLVGRRLFPTMCARFVCMALTPPESDMIVFG
jgi:hypothetical protein